MVLQEDGEFLSYVGERPITTSEMMTYNPAKLGKHALRAFLHLASAHWILAMPATAREYKVNLSNAKKKLDIECSRLSDEANRPTECLKMWQDKTIKQ